MSIELCPCCSGKSYADCCELLHLGGKPKAAENLMRSRYSAFAKQKIDYLINTVHPRQKDEQDKNDLFHFSKISQWLGLKILDTQELSKNKSMVKFEVTMRDESGVEHRYQETSLFIWQNDFCFYVDIHSLPAPQSACLCGSGRKFKQCCEKLLNTLI